jgi:hypothetical protein
MGAAPTKFRCLTLIPGLPAAQDRASIFSALSPFHNLCMSVQHVSVRFQDQTNLPFVTMTDHNPLQSV